jgi:hypothetical protein
MVALYLVEYGNAVGVRLGVNEFVVISAEQEQVRVFVTVFVTQLRSPTRALSAISDDMSSLA